MMSANTGYLTLRHTARRWGQLAAIAAVAVSLGRAGEPQVQRYRLRHVFQNGQVLRGSVARGRLILTRTAGTQTTLYTTTKTEIRLAVEPGQDSGVKSVAAQWKDVRVLSETGDGVREFRADPKQESGSLFNRLVDRELMFRVTPDGGITLVSGQQEFLGLLKHMALAPSKDQWQGALEQFLREPNVYLPQKPVAVGDRWTVRRRLRVAPLGYPIVLSLASGTEASEDTTARLVRIDKTKQGRVAHVELSGRVTSPIKAFELEGSVRVNLDRASLDRQRIELTDPKATKAHKDPTSRFSIGLEVR